MDQEIAPLVATLNGTGFIRTLSSCAGHPDEKLEGFQYAVANVVFDIEDEPDNLFRFYRFIEELYKRRTAVRTEHEFSFSFDKRLTLGEHDTLTWDWILRVQGSGTGPIQCRKALDAAFGFLSESVIQLSHLNEVV
jgi:hypothetical protein